MDPHGGDSHPPNSGDRVGDSSLTPSSVELMIASMTRMFDRQEAREARLEAREARYEALQLVPAEAGPVPRQAGRLVAEFQKLKPPVYRGARDAVELDSWFDQMEKLFLVMECTEDQRLVLAPHQLEGPAHIWWKQEVPRLGAVRLTWDQFQRRLRDKFIPKTVTQQLRDTFLHIRQGQRSVSEYEEEFARLARYAEALVATEEDRIDHFVQGLQIRIRSMVVAHPVLSYADAVQSALMIERSEAGRDTGFQRGKRTFSRPGGARRSKFQRDTRGERREVTCYFCGRPGHYASDCRQRLGGGHRPVAAPVSSTAVVPARRVCFHCQQPGHVASECPKRRQSGRARGGRPRGRGRVFSMTREEIIGNPGVISGMN